MKVASVNNWPSSVTSSPLIFILSVTFGAYYFNVSKIQILAGKAYITHLVDVWLRSGSGGNNVLDKAGNFGHDVDAV